MCTPLACSDYYGASVPSSDHQSTTDLPMAGPDARPGGRPRTVPAFTITRSTREVPSSTPTASPHLRRRPSTWPPHRRRITGFGVDPATRPESCAAFRPISARLEPATRLRSITTGSSRAPSHLACRTHTVWQYRCVPALSGPLAARTVRLHGRTAPSFDRLAATSRRRVLPPRPVTVMAPRGALRPRVATTTIVHTRASRTPDRSTRYRHRSPTSATPVPHTSADMTTSAASSTNTSMPPDLPG